MTSSPPYYVSLSNRFPNLGSIQICHSALTYSSRPKRLVKVDELQKQKAAEIARTLADLKQLLVNHGIQLRALYEGRQDDVAKLNDLDANGSARNDGMN